MRKKQIDAGVLFGLNFAQIKAALTPFDNASFRAEQIYLWLYRERVLDFSKMTNLPDSLKVSLQQTFRLPTLTLIRESKSVDGTEKYLFQLADGLEIETVLIPSEMRDESTLSPKRKTLCVSTQVGCPLDCKFCATGTLKLKRNLTAAEILLQLFEVEKIAKDRITNIVFMGMGEPMLNLDNVVNSIRILTDPKLGLINKSRITVSTSGIPEAIVSFAKENLKVKLALSLHATTDDLRTKLMPINKRYPLQEVIAAMEEYYRITHIPVTYEYILFEGLNDSFEDARRLARIARRVPSKINVIPFHPIDFTHPEGIAQSLHTPSDKVFTQFIQSLRDEGAQVMIRSSSGKDIEAACGQLALSSEYEKRTVVHSIALPSESSY